MIVLAGLGLVFGMLAAAAGLFQLGRVSDDVTDELLRGQLRQSPVTRPDYIGGVLLLSLGSVLIIAGSVTLAMAVVGWLGG